MSYIPGSREEYLAENPPESRGVKAKVAKKMSTADKWGAKMKKISKGLTKRHKQWEKKQK